MFSLGLILVFLFLALFGLTSTINYCDPSLCTDNDIVKHHIACDNNGEFRSNCQEPAIIEITQKIKKSIVFWHNEYRNKVANGSLGGFQSARRMTTVTWDTELAYLAGLSVLTCKLEQDECHNTFAYKYSGQNLASQYHKQTINPSTYENIIVSFIKKWFDEYKFANQGDVDKCSESGLSRNIGHFTAMIQEKSAKIGCGLARFSEVIKGNKWYVILLDCNYSFTNMVDMPIYVKGPMCSSCKAGPNRNFNGLCSLAEYVPPIPNSAYVKLNVIRPRALYKPATIKSLPPTNTGFTKEPAARVVKPYNPNENLYIKTEPNPKVRGIIRPVPVVTWRGPVYSKNQTIRPILTQQGQTPVASHRDQTAYKQIVRNPPVRSNDIIQPVPVVTWRGPVYNKNQTTRPAFTQQNQTPVGSHRDQIAYKRGPNPKLLSNDDFMTRRNAVFTNSGPTKPVTSEPADPTLNIMGEPIPLVGSNDIIQPVPVLTKSDPTSPAINELAGQTLNIMDEPIPLVGSNDIIQPVPVLTNSGPTMPATSEPAGQTLNIMDEPIPLVGSNDIIQPVPVLTNSGPTMPATSEPAGQTLNIMDEPIPLVGSNDIIQPVPVLTNSGPTTPATSEPAGPTLNIMDEPILLVGSNDPIRPVPVLTNSGPTTPATSEPAGPTLNIMDEPILLVGSNDPIRPVPVVVDSSSRSATSETTRPVSTQQGQTPADSNRKQTAHKRVNPTLLDPDRPN